jgi:uncharacterized protein YndB with AHSA1/START domain
LEVPGDSVQIEPRVGGRLHFSMVEAGGGAEYPVRFEILEILEISEPELLVLRSEAMPELGIPDPTITRAEFEEDGAHQGDADRGPPHRRGASAGWGSCFDKLEALLLRE